MRTGPLDDFPPDASLLAPSPVCRRHSRGNASALVLLLVLGCSGPTPFSQIADELSLVNRIEAAFHRSVDAEESAVLATSEEAAKVFASQSREEADEVSKNLGELGALIHTDNRPETKKDFQAVEDAWQDLQAIDDSLLALAVANTNTKALRLASQDGVAALDKFLGALAGLATDSEDPDRMRELWFASVSALRCQILLPTHVSSANDDEMTEIEKKLHGLSGSVTVVLEKVRSDDGDESTPALDQATAAWTEYERVSKEVVRLSRENTNVRSLALSNNEKRRAAETFRAAVQTLADEIDAPLSATR